MVEGGGTTDQLMVSGGWTSERVAHGYYEDSEQAAGERANRIVESEQAETAQPPTETPPVTVTMTFQPNGGQRVQATLGEN